MKEDIKTSPTARQPASKALATVVSLLLLAVTAGAQGTLSYGFSGTVQGLNQAASIFPGVTLGTSVQGVFTVDYNAVDADPSPIHGSYSSEGFSLDGTIGASAFSSVANPGNTVTTHTDQFPTFTWAIFTFAPTKGLEELSLTFYDGRGQAVQSDALPGSAAAFSAFSQMVLYARGTDGTFGSYTLDVNITRVPEPATLALCGAGLFLMISLRRGLNCHLPTSRSRP